MNPKEPKVQKTKRQILRDQRMKKERTQRLVTIGGIVGVVIVIIAIIAIPAIKQATTPVGDFVKISSGSWQNANGANLGDPNAKIKIELFEDFRCSACQTFNQTIEPKVISELVNTGQVYYVFHPYPFLDDNSPLKESDQSANAAMCAAVQNRFWDYKEILFANLNFQAGEFSDKRLTAFAESIGLDMGKFNSCFKGNEQQAQINLSINAGQIYGITGTPSLFVNGEQVAPGYVPTYEQILEAVTKAGG